MINVKDFPYNARGDGETDDAEAIYRAISDAALTGETVFFPTGTFVLGSLLAFRHLNHVSLQGSGQGTILRSGINPEIPTPGRATMFVFNNCADFFLRDIVFDNNGIITTAFNTSLVAMVSCINFVVSGCAFIGAQRHTLQIQSSQRFWIKENYFSCNELSGAVFTAAIMLVDNISQGGPGWILNNEIVGSACGGRGVDMVWENNRITNFGYGSGIFAGNDSLGFGTHAWTITGNTITGGQPARDANGLYPKAIEVFAPKSRIIGNNCYNNAGGGIVFGGRHSIVANNICTDNGMPGNGNAGIVTSYVLPSMDASYSIIAGNICKNIAGGNQDYGYKDAGRGSIETTGLRFYGNDFSGNLVADFLKAPTTTLYVWGDDPDDAPWLQP